MYKIVGRIRHYDWGTSDVIPGLLGKSQDGQPHAEYWLGSYHASPSQICDLSQNLDQYLLNNPQALGQARHKFGDTLPYLVKILSAAQPLSLQAHPNSEQAFEGFHFENSEGVPLDDPTRTYRDLHAKPELLIALTQFDALVGFRDPKETVNLFDALETPTSLDPIIGPLRHRCSEVALAEVFLDSLTSSELHHELANEVLAACFRHVSEDSPLGEMARTAVYLDEHFPHDTSIFAALLLNRYHLEPGEAIHVPPGTMHSYLAGSGIEVMASSDNVLRGGLTTKHINVDALVQVVNFCPATGYKVLPHMVSDQLASYPINEEAFQVWHLMPTGKPCELPGQDQPRILLALYDDVTLHGETVLKLSGGESAFIPAGEHVNIDGAGQAFLAATT